jgi:hypothetical protein
VAFCEARAGGIVIGGITSGFRPIEGSTPTGGGADPGPATLGEAGAALGFCDAVAGIVIGGITSGCSEIEGSTPTGLTV